MSSQARVISDEPSTQIELLPTRKRLIDQITRSIILSETPLVIGVHGDWGSGKTSFLHYLNYWLTGDTTAHPELKKLPPRTGAAKNLVPVWFEAWRYQQESAPVVALLHEMRSKFTLWTKNRTETKKIGEVTIRGALLALEDITKKIGIQASKIQEAGDAYEKERLSNALPSAQLREFLDDALGKLLGREGKDDRRLIIFIDDLDRCEPDTAYRLLEGLKIYLNLRRCIFVLGLNQREVERALAKVMPSATPGQPTDSSALMIRAHEYMEKICANVWHLSRVSVKDQVRLLRYWLEDTLPSDFLDAVCTLLEKHEFLPCNTRRTKAFANTLLRCYDIRVEEVPGDLPQIPAVTDVPLLCIVAVLQQFHPHLWRHVEAEPEFLLELQSYARGTLSKLPPGPGAVRRATDLHPELGALELPNDGVVDPNSSVLTFSSRFADLAYGNVLHCQRLLATAAFTLQYVRTFLGR